MEIIYAIYKENIIPLVGGVNPNNIEIGLADYRGWKLCAMNENEIVKFSEFKMYPVSKAIAVGMTLIGKTSMIENQAYLDIPKPPAFNNEQITTTVKLTEEEEILAETAKKFLDALELKFAVRAKVRAFKDFEDDVADIKLLVEFLLGYIVEDFSMKSEQEQEKYPIKDLVISLSGVIGESDLRINNEKILNKVSNIIADESFIARIVKTTYSANVRK